MRWRRNRLPTPVFLDFPCGSAGKESACSVGRPGFDPWVGRFPRRREKLPTPLFWPGELIFHGNIGNISALIQMATRGRVHFHFSENIYLKTCPTRFPGAQRASIHPEFPQRVLQVNSCSSTGFNLSRGRWQMNLWLQREWIYGC